MTTSTGYLATPWDETGVPVPDLPRADGPPPMAHVDVSRRADLPVQRTPERVPSPASA